MKEYGLPEIYEDQAFGDLKLLYEDIKNVLKVPFVNFVFRSTILYGSFLPYAWEQVRPSLLTINFEQDATSLQSPPIKYTMPKINWYQYYDSNTLFRIKEIVKAFRYVNPKLLIILQAWFESLSNRSIEGTSKIQGYTKPGSITPLKHIPLVDVAHSPLPIQSLLLDIAEKHRSMDVASDYRALAYYPCFLNRAWKYLGSYTQTDEYQLLRNNLLKKSLTAARNLPFPVDLQPYIQRIDLSSEIALGIMASVSLFKDFIPGLIIDCEFLWQLISYN